MNFLSYLNGDLFEHIEEKSTQKFDNYSWKFSFALHAGQFGDKFLI